MLVDWGFGDVSFLARLGVLLVVLGAILAWDYRRHGAKGTRWREYLFLVAVGLLGAGIGVAHDLVTSSISEDYFVIGKGMNKGVGFRSSVIELGAHAGFFAAVVGAGIYLLANGRRDGTSPLSLGRLARLVWKPLVCALLGAAVLGGLATACAAGRRTAPRVCARAQHARTSPFRQGLGHPHRSLRRPTLGSGLGRAVHPFVPSRCDGE